MAKEFKTLNVSTEKEERTIHAFQTFGWTLKNNQEIYVKDSHTEAWGNQRFSVTETTHYVKLSFERDGSKLRYYQQLRELENMFWSVPEPKKPNGNWKKVYIAEYAIFGAFAFIFLILPGSVLNMGAFVCAAVAAPFAYLHYRFNQKMKAWQAAYKKCWKKREQILEKAESYLE